MIYERRGPCAELEDLVNCYWLIDSEAASSIERQKIVPDGYPEIILHYGEAYRIDLRDGWQVQESTLLAGQIKKHFFLENTGISGMVGIKFQPTALTHLFDLDMYEITEKVVSLPQPLSELLQGLELNSGPSASTTFDHLDQVFTSLMQDKPISHKEVDMAVKTIIEHKGNLSMQEVCDAANTSERQLERQFKRYVGLSPKFYSRIIRLGHIFELMQKGDQSWSDLVYQSGFYDQSHFIKNFKEFTGEDPSSYGFDEQNMANFHLKK